jgi:hypothetical protein
MSAVLILKPKSEAMIYEGTTERRFVERIEYPPEGGILTWFENETYPDKQLVYPEMFVLMDTFKRSMPATLRLLKTSFLAKVFLVLAFIIPGSKRFREKVISTYVDIIWTGLVKVALKPSYLCKSGREIRRTLLTILKERKSRIEGRYEQLIEAVCLFWEYDNYYRALGQDMAGIFNKESFLNNPSKELTRVIEESMRRNPAAPVRKKIKLMLFFLNIILIFPSNRRLTKDFIKELDLEKIKMDTGDRYWSYHRTDYNVDGLDLIDRMRKRHLMKMKGKK